MHTQTEPGCEAALAQFLEVSRQFAGRLDTDEAIVVFVDPYSNSVVSYIDGVDETELEVDDAQLQADLGPLRDILQGLTSIGFETAVAGNRFAIFGQRTISGDTTDLVCVLDFTRDESEVTVTGSASLLNDQVLLALEGMSDAHFIQEQPLAVHALHNSRAIALVYQRSYGCKDALDLLGEDLTDLIDCICDIHADPNSSLRLATMSYLAADPETGEMLRSVRASRIVTEYAFLS
jgi:hypothetical protein